MQRKSDTAYTTTKGCVSAKTRKYFRHRAGSRQPRNPDWGVQLFWGTHFGK